VNILRAAALAVALTTTAGAANAGLVQSQTFTTDAAFLAYLANNGATLPANEVFVAQTRSGGPTTYELGLHVQPNFTNAAPVGTAGNLNWGNGTWYGFTLSRSGNTVTFNIGSYNGSWTDTDVGDVDALGFRVRSSGTGNTEIRNLTFNGSLLADPALNAANGPNGVELFVLSGIDTGDFTLTGQTRLTWTGNMPGGSSLGFQIKGVEGFITAVPEPATLGLLGAGLVGLGLARRRKAFVQGILKPSRKEPIPAIPTAA
jgi:hypothetical protein